MKKGKVWKRNAVVLAIVLFVCGAVYMNWSYNQDDTAAGKTLGEAALVGGKGTTEQTEAAKDGKAAEGDKAAAEQTAKEGDKNATAQAPKEGDKNATAQPNAAADSAYFSEARLNRQQARDSAMSLLQEAATDEKAGKDTVEEANKSIQTMANYTLSEAQIENLVVAKGYTNCVAFLNDESISVVVSGVENGLQSTDVAKIGEIVMQQTGLKADQIKIIEAN